jgi:Uncharacterized protein conserved in bacteria
MTDRLRRIEGQIRGIEKMVEEDRYCIDILTQTNAVAASVNSFSKSLLERHLRTCVVEDVKNGGNGKIDELCLIMKTLMR